MKIKVKSKSKRINLAGLGGERLYSQHPGRLRKGVAIQAQHEYLHKTLSQSKTEERAGDIVQ